MGTGALVAMPPEGTADAQRGIGGRWARVRFAIGRDNGWLTHSGEVPGYNTQFGYLPKLKATIVVLTNTDI